MKSDKVLITGGAGFIGSNLANQLIQQGHQVVVFDNMSRSGCEQNIAWLKQSHGDRSFDLVAADLTDFEVLKRTTEGVDRVYHFAGQVAVTTSVKDPRQDFMSNALGTFNALEAARLVGNNPIFIYSSSNKVYGGMEHIEIAEGGERYAYATLPHGIPETQGIDFHSPYGCSKGAGDQYTHDYARIYGLRTVVARQSCIYGYRQFGIEDQGWVAWFIIAALKNRPISIYGNGKQVRDVLFIDDLLDAYELMVENINTTAGQIYNIGGGPEHTISIWQEFGPLLEEFLGKEIPVTYETWRPGDQPIYVSDIRKAKTDFGWEPKVSVPEGVQKLAAWIQANHSLFEHL
ncbi:MAG: SDR family NAD(P)-dependent oxidoreductase [Chloroflexota bacterium]